MVLPETAAPQPQNKLIEMTITATSDLNNIGIFTAQPGDALK